MAGHSTYVCNKPRILSRTNSTRMILLGEVKGASSRHVRVRESLRLPTWSINPHATLQGLDAPGRNPSPESKARNPRRGLVGLGEKLGNWALRGAVALHPGYEGPCRRCSSRRIIHPARRDCNHTYLVCSASNVLCCPTRLGTDELLISPEELRIGSKPPLSNGAASALVLPDWPATLL